MRNPVEPVVGAVLEFLFKTCDVDYELALALLVCSAVNTVIAAQTLLNHLGCDAGTPDGSAGAMTGAAVDRFTRVTGHDGSAVDARLVRRLAEAVAAGERC